MRESYKQKFITKVGVIFPFPLFHAVANQHYYCLTLTNFKYTTVTDSKILSKKIMKEGSRLS